MKKCRSILVVLLLFGCFLFGAKAQTRNSLVFSKDKLILLIDLRSSKAQLDSIFKIAGVNNATNAILKGDIAILAKDGWTIGKPNKNIVRYERSLATLNVNPQNPPYQITTNLSADINPGSPGYPADETYGVNKFTQTPVTELSVTVSRFFLPGYLNAKRVLLSGNFNGWSTLKGRMTKTDSGWVADVKLLPGVYEYKYIIDGRWQRDRNNLQQHSDGFNDVNSVYYKPNRVFKLSGFSNATKVSLAGSFNDWNTNNVPLQKKGGVWQTQVYLHEGMHTYRFLVDGRWVTDPNNPTTLKGPDGNINSVINMGETVNFKLNGYPSAQNVYVAGNFNNWKPGQISLKKTATGWAVSLTIPAGNYGYKFIVDGKWMTDPLNSRHVTEANEYNSFIAVKPNYTFRLKGYANSKIIHLAGTFNNWAEDGFTLAHDDDEWTISLYLKPGKYRYKFLVDGNWILDPGNKLYEQNEFNTGNSVLWIE
jgi:hypothetical protein